MNAMVLNDQYIIELTTGFILHRYRCKIYFRMSPQYFRMNNFSSQNWNPKYLYRSTYFFNLLFCINYLFQLNDVDKIIFQNA